MNSKKKIGKFGKDLGERGIFDTRNTLNELTGKEWTHFINSVTVTNYTEEELKLWKYLMDSLIETKYPTNGESSISHKLRKIHPSPKPPQLMKDIIAFFTKGGDWILDPFMGVGGTLLGASLLEPVRNVIGIDLEPKYIEIYKKVCDNEKIKKQMGVIKDIQQIKYAFDSMKNSFNNPFELIYHSLMPAQPHRLF